MSDITEKLKQIDLTKVTLDDLQKLENITLRNSLIDMIRNPGMRAASGHQNHGSHTNTSSDLVHHELGVAVKDVAKDVTKGGAIK